MRAVVRGDLDGIVCATLLKASGLVDTVHIVRVSDVVSGKVEITNQDIVCNLPYQPDAFLWFDHHSSEMKHVPPLPSDLHGGFTLAPSTAGVVYKYLLSSNPKVERFAELVRDTDILDSADLTVEDVRNPQGNIRLGLLLDPRTRLSAPAPATGADQFLQPSRSDYQLSLLAEATRAVPPGRRQWCYSDHITARQRHRAATVRRSGGDAGASERVV